MSETSSNSSNPVRIVLSAVLLAGIGGLLWMLLDQESHTEAAQRRFKERVAEYAQLRKDNDWVKLYDMLTPEHRKRKSLADFLQIFGTGVLKVHEMELLEYVMSPNDRVAEASLSVDMELDQSRLPEIARNVRIPDPSAKRRQEVLKLGWSWKDGDWYWHMDGQVLSGKDSQGDNITVYGPDEEPKAPATPPTKPK